MNIKDLKEIIESLPDDMEIIIQKDSEGNGYSPLWTTDSECVYIEENNWSGEVYSLSCTAEDHDMEDEEWETLKEMQKCLVLVPTN